MPSGVMPVSLLMWFLVYHYRVAPLRVLGSPLILPTPDNWSHEETDDPLYADRRGFYKVEKWSRKAKTIIALRLIGRLKQVAFIGWAVVRLSSSKS